MKNIFFLNFIFIEELKLEKLEKKMFATFENLDTKETKDVINNSLTGYKL